MDKLRFRLLICLILIFAIITLAFLLTLFGESNSITGAATADSAGLGSLAWTIYLPGVFFIGLIILSVFYLEKKQ